MIKCVSPPLCESRRRFFYMTIDKIYINAHDHLSSLKIQSVFFRRYSYGKPIDAKMGVLYGVLWVGK